VNPTNNSDERTQTVGAGKLPICLAVSIVSAYRRHLLGRLKGLGLPNKVIRRMRRYWPLFHPLHQVRMTRPRDAFFFGRTIELGVDVIAALALGLLHLHLNAMGIGPGILANASNLPGDLGLPALVKALQLCRPELFPAFPALRLTRYPLGRSCRNERDDTGNSRAANT